VSRRKHSALGHKPFIARLTERTTADHEDESGSLVWLPPVGKIGACLNAPRR